MEDRKKQSVKKTYKRENLQGADFRGADLRGVDFTGAVLTNADFTKCKTGLKTSSAVLVFIFSLSISLLSGYIAMLTGRTVQLMLKSTDTNIVTSGYVIFGLILFFILLSIWKGGKNTLLSVIITIVAALLIGLVSWLSGAGTGMGSFYSSLALILFVLMIFAGVISRATAGTMSSTFIYLIVAIGGSVVSKSLGGGLGTMVLAVSCAIISKRILADKSEFPLIKKIALSIGSYFGTSFKNADLTNANFSDSTINNTNFTGAKLSGVKWENSIKKFTLEDS